MKIQEWERDVINRQRNIVFPDTVLNEGRFYRNIASGKAVFTVGQRISLLGIAGYFLFVSTVDFAGRFGEFLAKDHSQFRGWVLWPSFYSLIWLIFWIFLAIKGLFPAPARPRKHRGGYQQSHRA
jgi:hypothetical protein